MHDGLPAANTHTRRHGLEDLDPPVILREWVPSIRPTLAGEEVNLDGEVVQLEDVHLGSTLAAVTSQCTFGSTSRKGLKIAGTIGDGVLLNAICSPEYSANALKIVREGVARSRRKPEDFKVAQLIDCSVEDDHQKAVDAIKSEVASKLDPIQLPFIAGPKMRVGEPYKKEEHIPKFEEAWARGGKEGLIKPVPDSYVEEMTVSGTEEEVQARAQQFETFGSIFRSCARRRSIRRVA